MLPSKQTYPGTWERWTEHVNLVREMEWKSWKEALGSDTTATDVTPKLPCNVCGQKCKTLLSSCGGDGEDSCNLPMHTGANDALEWWQAPNPWIHHTDDTTTPLNPWIYTTNVEIPPLISENYKQQEAASIDVPKAIDMNNELPKWRNKNQRNLEYPIMEYEWRIQGEIGLEAMNFHRKIDCEFSLANVKSIAQAGNELVRSAGSLEKALCYFQEVEFRKLNTQMEYIQQNRAWIPHLADEMSEVMRIGATADYRRPPPTSPRRRGFPYKGKETLGIVQKMRNDIAKGRMFVCGTECIGGENAQVEATPTTLAPKRNPDR